jgi:hypothetical protein
MGGTLTSIFFITAGPSAGGKRVISTYCWVLREHASDLLEGRNDKRETQVIPQRERKFWLVRCLHEFSACVLFENCTVDASIFVVSV